MESIVTIMSIENVIVRMIEMYVQISQSLQDNSSFKANGMGE